MKYFELDKDEQQLLEVYESGKPRALPGFQRARKQYQKYAKAVLKKGELGPSAPTVPDEAE